MRGHAVVLAATLAWSISVESAEAKLDILVDKAAQRMLVIQDGYIRFMWPVSTGRDATQTPNGQFTPQRLERNWSSSAYYDSPMPFSIFFHHGYAIHGSYAIDRLGGPASHGCVRLHPHHAAILFDLVQLEGPNRTTIEVTDLGRPAEPPLPRREFAEGPGMNQPPPRRVRYPLAADSAQPCSRAAQSIEYCQQCVAAKAGGSSRARGGYPARQCAARTARGRRGRNDHRRFADTGRSLRPPFQAEAR